MVMYQLLLFLLFVAVGAQNERSGNISLGSSLSPNIQPSSWTSPSGLFAFGFYPQGKGFAVGIWLADKPNNTVVWTANRDDPPVSSNSTIEFTEDGRLLLLTDQGVEKPIVGDLPMPATSASMLDSGNFVIYNRSRVIWESFDYPTDTILGGQNLANNNLLVSSVSTSNPSSGQFYLRMQADNNLVALPVNSSAVPENTYWNTKTVTPTRVRTFQLSLNITGHLCLRDSTGLDVFTLANNSNPGNNDTVIYRATLDPDGNFRLYSHKFMTVDNSNMSIKWQALQNKCEALGICGVNTFCSSTGSSAGNCVCLPGFEFVNPNTKFLGCYRSFIDEDGCSRTEPTLSYNITVVENVDWGGYPYTVKLIDKKEDCRQSCLEDCNCWAALYRSGFCNKHKLPIIYGIRNENKSATAFVKVSFPFNPSTPTNYQTVVVETKKTLVLILAVSFGFLAFFCSVVAISSFVFYRRRAYRYHRLSKNANKGLNGEFILRSFSYEELEKATDGFKEVLGRNSLGAVYKGAIAECNKIVAVKRLENVVEGEREFRAEMTAIGHTHHRNLVQLLGFCVEGTRKLLVYEFMNNGSLADLLFKDDMRPPLKERVRIALDVARGILYLHEECDTRIIHCNIKPQNILMDDSWTAKISDLGLAKLLMPNQSGTLTGVRGTRGYLAPEWHKNTLISEKVDVYSFGVVLLEILCCRSNMEINVSNADEVLLCNWVYSCFVAKDLERLIGDEEADVKSFGRMVKVGLLCILDDPNLRPSMKNVILMLEGTMDVPDTHLII